MLSEKSLSPYSKSFVGIIFERLLIWTNGCNNCEIERFKTRSPKEMFRNINYITKKKYCTAGGCFRAKDGSIIIEKEAMIERWTEYITDLFDDERGEMPSISNMLGPKILTSEVQAAVQSMKNKQSNRHR